MFNTAAIAVPRHHSRMDDPSALSWTSMSEPLSRPGGQPDTGSSTHPFGVTHCAAGRHATGFGRHHSQSRALASSPLSGTLNQTAQVGRRHANARGLKTGEWGVTGWN
jgi:hypothetical protein